MDGVLRAASDLLPLPYAVDAMRTVTVSTGVQGDVWRDLAVVAGAIGVALALGAATLRRRSA